MKQKDIIVIIVVVFIAGLASYFISTKLFVKKGDTEQKAKVVEKISTDFNPPSNKYFNKQSVNPTQKINIGDQQPAPTPPTN